MLQSMAMFLLEWWERKRERGRERRANCSAKAGALARPRHRRNCKRGWIAWCSRVHPGGRHIVAASEYAGNREQTHDVVKFFIIFFFFKISVSTQLRFLWLDHTRMADAPGKGRVRKVSAMLLCGRVFGYRVGFCNRSRPCPAVFAMRLIVCIFLFIQFHHNTSDIIVLLYCCCSPATTALLPTVICR